MKKSLIVLMCLVFGTFVFAGCIYIRLGGGSVVGNGKIETREVSLGGDLKGVRDTGPFEVVIDPALSGKAVMEGESNILDAMQVVVDGSGVLNITSQPNVSLMPHSTVTVRTPAISGGLIETDGNGNIRLQGDVALKGDAFELHINGSGDMSLNLEAKDITAGINGSGNIRLTGSATNETVTINGSGNFDAFDCQSQNC
jgi:hypothetical protein